MSTPGIYAMLWLGFLLVLIGGIKVWVWWSERRAVKRWKRAGFTPDHIESLRARYFR